MAASKPTRAQSTVDPVTGIKVDQELIQVNFSFTGIYNQIMSRDGKTYPNEIKNESISNSFSIPSVEALDKIIEENPFIAPLLLTFQEHIKTAFK